QLALQRSAVEELKGAQAEGARGEDVFQQIVNEHRLLRKRADHLQRAMEELRIRLRAFEAMRENEAVVSAKERRVLSRDHFRVHFVRVGEKGDAVALAHVLEYLFDAGHRAVEEIRPERAKVVQRAAISGLIAEEVVELAEGDGAALEIA